MREQPIVAILQPYVPKYREEFFNRLIARLHNEGISCHIYSASDAQHTTRGDAAKPEWLRNYADQRLQILNRSISLGGSRRAWSDADAVILGLVGSSVDSYRAVLDKQRRGLRVGFWGHIRPYVTKGNRLDLMLETELMRRADHVFAYTSGGAEYAIQRGVPGEHLTTVMNAVDTAKLEVERDNLKMHPDQVAAFCRSQGVDPMRTFSYVGALDQPKRIDFLAKSLDILWSRDRSIKILLAGRGPDEHLLADSVDRGQIVKLGFADAALQAMMAASSIAFVMPGRIGLVAVESLVLGKPILTTTWQYHSAEKEYLTEGDSMFSSVNTSAAYANLLQSFVHLNRSDSDTWSNWAYPTIDKMVDRFSGGVLRMLER